MNRVANEPLRTRATYRDIELYAPDRAPTAIDLSDNTNRWGVPPAALREMQRAAKTSMSRYPDLYGASLKRALAAYTGVDPSMIVTGCGSDDVLDSAIRAFSEAGELVATLDPSFPMIPLFARMNGLECALIPLDASYGVDADAIAALDASVTYLCSPNNPTGTTIPRSTIESIVARARGVVIVDEAYVEFSDASILDLVERSSNLLVVRTMSKAFGLAGLRVGYAVGAPALVAEVEKSRGPYKVNAIAERAAVAALTEDLDWVREHIALAVTSREALTGELAARGISVVPSLANFVFAPVGNAQAIASRMRQSGVAVRAYEGLRATSPALERTRGSALRISVAPWPEIGAALSAFDEARIACA
ncbi:MAG TPA: aminotransferase class I/II-fold pyridoxal phosphate-dependent enzyme [Gemmatimonadaceae bacterium]